MKATEAEKEAKKRYYYAHHEKMLEKARKYHSQVTSTMSDEDILFITLVGLDKAKDIPTNTGTAADAAKSYIGVLKNLISEHMKEKGE